MCKEIETITFCSCSENLNIDNDGDSSNYIWILERVIGFDRSGLIGMTLLPAKHLDNLHPEFILQELNTKQLFDFEYLPKDNDSLRIERINRRNRQQREYLYGEYLNFYYFKNEWHIGQVSPFMYDLMDYRDGKVKLNFKDIISNDSKIDEK